MANKYRFKISSQDKTITIDIEENQTFDEFRKLIDQQFGLPNLHSFAFVDGNRILVDHLDQQVTLYDKIHLDQELQYLVHDDKENYSLDIIVWDYIIDVSDETIKKFLSLSKKIQKLYPKQKYYLNNKQRHFVDTQLGDCFDVLKSHSFSGIYNFRLIKNGKQYLLVKVIYYILHHKYEIHIYDSLQKFNNNHDDYLITFYETNRSYFKGYQGIHRNIFVLCHGDTLKKEDFNEFYNYLNLIIYMLQTVKPDLLFESHDGYLEYDIINEKAKRKNR